MTDLTRLCATCPHCKYPLSVSVADELPHLTKLNALIDAIVEREQAMGVAAPVRPSAAKLFAFVVNECARRGDALTSDDIIVARRDLARPFDIDHNRALFTAAERDAFVLGLQPSSRKRPAPAVQRVFAPKRAKADEAAAAAGAGGDDAVSSVAAIPPPPPPSPLSAVDRLVGDILADAASSL